MADEQTWDSPNQQVVRPDQSHPSEEGTGGSQQQEDDGKPKRSSSRSDKVKEE